MIFFPIYALTSFVTVWPVAADYSCVCNYSPDRTVYSQMAVTSHTIGSMYEFDCKPTGPETNDQTWVSVQFEHKYGYTKTDDDLQAQTCQGSVPNEDKVPIGQTTIPQPTVHHTTNPHTTVNQVTKLPSTVQTATEPPLLMTTSIQSIGNLKCTYKVFEHASTDNAILFNVDNKCYELVQLKKTWEAAEHDCVAKGGHLAHIPDAHRQTVISSNVQAMHSYEGVWIGLHDRQHENQFQWTSGDPVVYTYWMPGWVTYHADVEDCVRMGMGQYYGHWEDLRCNTTLDYICEFDIGQNGQLDGR